MSRESILKIEEAEAGAEKILADARAKAAEIVADAERDGKALCEQTEQETGDAAAQMMQQVRERILSVSERFREEGNEEAGEMQKKASLRMKSAEKIIMRGLMSRCR